MVRRVCGSFMLFQDVQVYLFIFKDLFTHLAMLGLCCCARAVSSCSKRGLLLVTVPRPLSW